MDNDIEIIYTIDPVESTLVYTYLDKNCFKEKKITKILVSHELKKCYEINN